MDDEEEDDRRVTRRSNEECRRIANNTKSYYGIPRVWPVNIGRILRLGKVLTLRGERPLIYECVDDHILGSKDAKTELVDGSVKITAKKTIDSLSTWGDGRHRMTLAHELGHAVMHATDGFVDHRASGANRETSLTFTLDNGNEIRLQFYDNSRCIMTLDAKQRTVTTAQFRKNFPTEIYTIPTLGPLEEEEELLTDQYVAQSISTRRAHRMFRNIWYRWKNEFPIFKKLVEDTWDGMTISRPELDLTYPPKLSMFCTEGRVDRELCWSGFGFQIWLQLLTHITNASKAHILVVDEPEIYLHPDLQHKLFQLLGTLPTLLPKQSRMSTQIGTNHRSDY